jgi:SH3-like domain-containing protein
MIFPRHSIAAAIVGSSILTMNLALAGQGQVDAMPKQLYQQLPPENQCLAKAYVIDASGKGLNIRQKPNLSGKILGRLPKSTAVNILGAQGEWILISVIDPIAQQVNFRQEGWVYSSLLGVSSKGYNLTSVSLYAQPSLRSKVVGKIPPNTDTNILSCNGKWLRVESKHHQYKGWLEPKQQCAAALTTCS